MSIVGPGIAEIFLRRIEGAQCWGVFMFEAENLRSQIEHHHQHLDVAATMGHGDRFARAIQSLVRFVLTPERVGEDVQEVGTCHIRSRVTLQHLPCKRFLLRILPRLRQRTCLRFEFRMLLL